MANYRVEFSEIAMAGLNRLSIRLGLEFPENQLTSMLRYMLTRDPTTLGLERCHAWPDRKFFIAKVYAKINVRVLIEITDDVSIIWNLGEASP